MNINIRRALKEDLPILLKLNKEYIRYSMQFDPTIKNEDVLYHDIKKLISEDNVCFLVLEIDGNITGCCFGEIRDHEPWSINSIVGEVHFVYVEPEFRGKGLSKKLIGELMNFFDEHSIREIRLSSYLKNERAVAFYEKLGFEKYSIKMRILK